MKYFRFLLLVFVIMYACSDEKKIDDAILDVPVRVEIDRFDEKFAKATPENLQNLKNAYPYLFPENFHDSIWIHKMNDTLQQQLEYEVSAIYSDFSSYEAELELLFKHLKYYFPFRRQIFPQP